MEGGVEKKSQDMTVIYDDSSLLERVSRACLSSVRTDARFEPNFWKILFLIAVAFGAKQF
jgi:hypothetical protein